jgi:predicted ATPase
MLTKIKLDGFKSLNQFQLDIKPGLNIFVGPNGSGKTNIILFFEFLSYLTTEDLYNAVTKVGGAGSIFKKQGERDYNQFITCTVDGCKKIGLEYIKYKYDFTIGISFDKDYLYFKEQVYKAKILSHFTYDTTIVDWDLILKQESQNDSSSKSSILLEDINPKKFKPRFAAEKKNNVDDIKRLSRAYLKDFNVSTISLFQAAFSFGDKNYPIISDFRSGETFNIVPSKVKQPEDSANPAGIKKDGSGLANTLYAMKKSRNNFFSYPLYFFGHPDISYSEETLSKIIENVKLANSSILNIDVSNDPFNNQLIVKVYIKSQGDDAMVLPLSAMSDGTIKWITLITAILTSREIFSIEEPENFLHPWMQSEIVNIMRNTFNAKSEESFILMTTHSETLLNYSRPDEIIVISLVNGRTIAKRLENIQLLNEEIKNTGFGLGYYYVSNALDNE